jgi:hypothetical protein
MKLPAMLFALAASAVAAAEGPGPQGAAPCPNASPMMRLDASRVENIDGTIEKVLVHERGPHGKGGVHLVLATAGGTLEVQLGPAWFIDNQEAKLKAGDTVSVRGARMTASAQPTLIAFDVKRGGETLRLREEDGTPLWAAWRGSHGPGRGCPHAGL